MIEYMFDVIVNEGEKYAAMAGKLEAKANKQFERLDVIALPPVKTPRRAVKHAVSFNLQR